MFRRPGAEKHCPRGIIMLSWAITFFVLALIAAVLGFGGLAASMAGIAKILFFVFLALFAISMISRALQGRSVA